MKALTYAEKWEEVKRLRQTAYNLKRAAIKALHPDWSDQEIDKAVKEIFLYATT